MWNLQKIVLVKKSIFFDVEFIYIFRVYKGLVFCVVMSSNGEQCYSGGIDGLIQGWNIINFNIDFYDFYDFFVL